MGERTRRAVWTTRNLLRKKAVETHMYFKPFTEVFHVIMNNYSRAQHDQLLLIRGFGGMRWVYPRIGYQSIARRSEEIGEPRGNPQRHWRKLWNFTQRITQAQNWTRAPGSMNDHDDCFNGYLIHYFCPNRWIAAIRQRWTFPLISLLCGIYLDTFWTRFLHL